MKKFFSLLTAALFAGSMFAAEITVSKSVSDLFGGVADQTQKLVLYSDGVLTISVSEGDNNGKLYGSGAEWRVYQSGNAVVTVAVKTGTIKTVSFTYDVKNTGTLLFGGNSLASDANATVNAASAQFVVGNTGSATNGLVKIKSFTVVYDGEAGTESDSVDDGGQGGDQGGDEIVINGLAYADAYFYEYGGTNYWDFDLYKDMDFETYEYTYPEVYIAVEAKSETAIAGSYVMDYAGYWKSAKDSVELNEASAQLTISFDGAQYTFSGKFLADDGKTYKFQCTPDVWAMNADTGEEITLDETQAIENITLTEKAQKVVVDGVVYIIRDNKLYNLQGTQVR